MSCKLKTKVLVTNKAITMITKSVPKGFYIRKEGVAYSIKDLDADEIETKRKELVAIVNAINTHFLAYKYGEVAYLEKNSEEMEVRLTIPEDLIEALNTVQEESEINAEEMSYSMGPSSGKIYQGYQINKFSSFTKLKALRKNEIVRLKRKLASIRALKRENKRNKSQFIKYTKLESIAKMAIDEADKQLSELDKAPEIDVLFSYFEQDIQKVEEFMKEGNHDLDKIADVEEILDFYNNVFTKNQSGLFSNRELTAAQYEQLRDNVKPFRERAEELQNKMTEIKEGIIKKAINEDERIQKMYGDTGLTENELFFSQSGLNDINSFTSYVQSPGYQIGLTSTNGSLAKMAEIFITEAHHKHMLPHQYFMHELEKMQKEVVDELKIKSFGKMTYVDYNKFRAKDSNGLMLDSIVSRYKAEIFRKTYKKENDFKTAISKSYRNGKVNPAVLRALNRKMNGHYRENFIVLDVFKTPELEKFILEKFPNVTLPHSSVKEAYRNSIVNEVGNKVYKEMIEEQKEMVEEYFIKLEVYENQQKEKLAAGIKGFTNTLVNNRIALFKKRNNPIMNSYLFHNSTSTTNITNYKNQFNVAMVPRKYKPGTTEETGYYDKAFEEIENNEVLYKFYKLLKEFTDYMYEGLTPEDRKRMNIWSIPAMQKSYRDILTDPTLNRMAKISKVFGKFFEWLRNLPRERQQGFFSGNLVNPTTGKVEDTIYSGNINFNKKEIERRTNEAVILLQNKMGIKFIKKKISRSVLVFENPYLMSLIADKLGIEATEAAISEALPNINFKHKQYVDTLIKRLVTNEVMMEQTVDLPKAMMTASYAMVAYKARQDALPLQRIIKEAHANIKSHVLNKQGKVKKTSVEDDDGERIEVPLVKGLRHNSIQQYDSWYKRVVLNDNSKISKANPLIERSSSYFEQKFSNNKVGRVIGELASKAGDAINIFKSKKDPSADELLGIRARLEGIKEGAKKSDDIYKLNKTINAIQDILNSKNYVVSASAIISNILYDGTRFLGLAYNVSSAMTNFFEGQIANVLAASTGRYFKEENYWEALRIMKYSMFKGVVGGYMDSVPMIKRTAFEVKLARVLMERYELLEDPYDELQKSSVKSKLDKLSNFKSAEMTSRVEYQNQTVLMIAILKETMITGKDGREISAWEAFMEGYDEGKAAGTLGENFRTNKNRLSFEKVTIDEAVDMQSFEGGIDIDKKFQTRISETILKIHGDYNKLRGGRFTDDLFGQGLSMFKRWLGSYLYTRFAPRQDNIALMITEKGRYRSLTPGSGALLGANYGFYSGGFVGMAVGGLIGFTVGSVSSKVNKLTSQSRYNITMIQEILLMNSMFIKRFLGIPLNFMYGGQIKILNPNEFKSDYFNNLNKSLENSYDSVDLKNIKGNIAEAAIFAWLTALLLLSKMAGWDDDDDARTSRRRRYHNLAVNKLMTLSSQMMAFSSPEETYKTFGTIASFRTINQFIEEFALIGNLISGGEDTIQSGYYKGKSKLWKKTKEVLLPSALRSFDTLPLSFGLEHLEDRQSYPSYFDDWFFGPKKIIKNEIKGMRKQLKNRLKAEGKSEKYINSFIRRTYKTRKTKKKAAETLDDNYKRIKSLLNDKKIYNKLETDIDAYRKKKKITD